jgi:hypothetical protein
MPIGFLKSSPVDLLTEWLEKVHDYKRGRNDIESDLL